MMVLKIRDLHLYYQTLRGEVKAVDGVSGESGCGQTSMSLGITRLLPKNVRVYKGSIQLEGKELMTLSNEQYRNEINWKKISMVFQGAMNSLNPVIKVGTQVAEPLTVHLDMKKEEAKAQVLEIFDKVGLPPTS